jgi:signal peptidase II
MAENEDTSLGDGTAPKSRISAQAPSRATPSDKPAPDGTDATDTGHDAVSDTDATDTRHDAVSDGTADEFSGALDDSDSLEEADALDDPSVTAPRFRTSAILAGIFGIAVVVLVLDQLSKMWAQSELEVGGAARPFIGSLIEFRLIYNPGAALSIASGQTWIMTILSAGVVAFIVVSARKIQSRAWACALGLVLGGAFGNLLDRLFREPGFPNGHVVDFIDYGPFIGNVADIAIVGAAILIALLALRGIGPDGKRSRASAGDDGEPQPSAPSTPTQDRGTP